MGENVLSSAHEPGPLRDGGRGGRFVMLPVLERSVALHKLLPQKVFHQQKCWFSGSLMLYLEVTFTFPQINSSVWLQFQVLCGDSENAGFYFILFPFLSCWGLVKWGGTYNLVGESSWMWLVRTLFKRSQRCISTWKRAWGKFYATPYFLSHSLTKKNTFIDSCFGYNPPNLSNFWVGGVNFESEFLISQGTDLLIVQIQRKICFA